MKYLGLYFVAPKKKSNSRQIKKKENHRRASLGAQGEVLVGAVQQPSSWKVRLFLEACCLSPLRSEAEEREKQSVRAAVALNGAALR